MPYIYQIKNDVNGHQYVGKTMTSVEKRFSDHCKESKRIRSKKRPQYDAMNKYGIEHFHISVLEECEASVLEERERFWIEKLGTFKNGYNATTGGDGKPYLDYSLIVETYRLVQNQKLTAQMLDIDPGTVRKVLRMFSENIISSSEIMRKEKSKKVLMKSKDGKVEKVFPSLSAAASYLIENEMTNCKRTTIRYHIAEVCNGKRKTAGGYFWSYLNN